MNTQQEIKNLIIKLTYVKLTHFDDQFQLKQIKFIPLKNSVVNQ